MIQEIIYELRNDVLNKPTVQTSCTCTSTSQMISFFFFFFFFNFQNKLTKFSVSPIDVMMWNLQAIGKMNLLSLSEEQTTNKYPSNFFALKYWQFLQTKKIVVNSNKCVQKTILIPPYWTPVCQHMDLFSRFVLHENRKLKYPILFGNRLQFFHGFFTFWHQHSFHENQNWLFLSTSSLAAYHNKIFKKTTAVF